MSYESCQPCVMDFFFKTFVYNFIVEQSNFLHWYNSFSKAFAFTLSGLHAPHQTGQKNGAFWSFIRYTGAVILHKPGDHND